MLGLNSRAERALEALRDSPEPIGASELAAALKCSPRTCRRYLATLIALDRGIEQLGSGKHVKYRASPREDSEQTLTPVHRMDLRRLLGLFPALFGLAFFKRLGRLVGWAPAANSIAFARSAEILEAAIAGHREVAFRYRNLRGEVKDRVVKPYDLRYLNGHVFLIGWDREASQSTKPGATPWRVFKDARFRTVPHHTGERFEEIDFDPERFQCSSGTIWQTEDYPVRIHLSAKAAEVGGDRPLRQEGQRLLPLKGGGVILECDDAGLMECTRWVMSWEGEAVVLSPPDLQVHMEKVAQRVMDRHTQLRRMAADGLLPPEEG